MFIEASWRQESLSSVTLAWIGNYFKVAPVGVLSDVSNGIWGSSTLSTAACHRFGFLTPLVMEQPEPQAPALKYLLPPYFMEWLCCSGVINEMHTRADIKYAKP